MMGMPPVPQIPQRHMLPSEAEVMRPSTLCHNWNQCAVNRLEWSSEVCFHWISHCDTVSSQCVGHWFNACTVQRIRQIVSRYLSALNHNRYHITLNKVNNLLKLHVICMQSMSVPENWRLLIEMNQNVCKCTPSAESNEPDYGRLGDWEEKAHSRCLWTRWRSAQEKAWGWKGISACAANYSSPWTRALGTVTTNGSHVHAWSIWAAWPRK